MRHAETRQSTFTFPRHRPGRPARQFQLVWGQWLGDPECPYLRRWVLKLGAFSLRVHHWFRSDDKRAHHDHPWWFLTLVLRGAYTDVSYRDEGDARYRVARSRLRRGSVRFRPARHRHIVDVHPGGCWTAMVTGPEMREWGFYPRGEYVPRSAYFERYGHHPCDQP